MSKILFVGKDFHPDTLGVSKYSTEMCLWLKEKKYTNVNVITGHPYYPEWKNKSQYPSFIYSQEKYRTLKVIRVPTYIPAYPTGLKRSLQNIIFSLASFPIILCKLIFDRPKCLISIVPSYTNTFSCVILSKIFRIKLFVHIQDLEINLADKLGLLPPYLLKVLYKLEKYILRNSYCISSISKKMLDEIQSKVDNPLNTILLPNWINNDEIFPDRKAGQNYRQRINIPLDAFLILYSGNIGNKQGFDKIIKIAMELKEEKSIQFLFVGSGTTKKELLKSIKINDLNNCKVMPLVEPTELNQLLNSADLHIVLQKDGLDNYILPSKLTNILGVGGECLVFGSKNSEMFNLDESFPGIIHFISKNNLNKYEFNKLLERFDDSKINNIAFKYSRDELNKDKIMTKYEKYINEKFK
tara:strand:+ start:1144 stop:2379 length:1236 start_codon:yes stop_codon:yes gene_type:complete